MQKEDASHMTDRFVIILGLSSVALFLAFSIYGMLVANNTYHDTLSTFFYQMAERGKLSYTQIIAILPFTFLIYRIRKHTQESPIILMVDAVKLISFFALFSYTLMLPVALSGYCIVAALGHSFLKMMNISRNEQSLKYFYFLGGFSFLVLMTNI